MQNMKARILLVLLFIGFTVFIFLSYQDKTADSSLIGKPAPHFILNDEVGKTFRWKDIQGKVTLVHFWATWCPSCLEEVPMLDKFIRKFPEDSFQLVAISMDDDIENVRKFREMSKFEFPVLFDPNGHVADDYGTYKLPETYLVDKNGIVVRKYIGPQNWFAPGYEREIRKLF